MNWYVTIDWRLALASGHAFIGLVLSNANIDTVQRKALANLLMALFWLGVAMLERMP